MLISADYEVFLGGNLIPEEDVLIKPTSILLEMMEELKVPLTLFCDVACIWRYRETGLNYFPELMEKQLKQAVINGHDVQAHLHPHWLNAKIIDGRYIYNKEEYFLGKIKKDYDQCYLYIYNLLHKAKKYLEELLKPIKDDYECIAFRAGGYGIQPREELIIKALIENGYLIDSSIIPNMKTSHINFTNVPRIANYFLDGRNGIYFPGNSGIFEIPIAAGYPGIKAYLEHILFKIINKIKKKIKGIRTYKHGYIIGEEDIKMPKNYSNQLLKTIKGIKNIFKRIWHFVEIEDDPKYLVKITMNYIKQYYKNQKDIFLAISMHPKTMRSDHFYCLANYYKKMKEIYGADLEAITFREVKNKIKRVKL